MIGGDGAIYLQSKYGGYAFGPDGTERWCNDLAAPNTTASTAIARDGTVYTMSTLFLRPNLYAFTPGGAFKWAAQFAMDFHGSPVIAASQAIICNAGNSGVCAVNPDGTLEWASADGPRQARRDSTHEA